MAIVQVQAALGDLGDISDFVGDAPLTVQGANATSVTLRDAQMDGFTLAGTGLTYGAAGVTGGSFTGLTIFSGAVGPLVTVTDFTTNAKMFYQIYQVAGIQAAIFDLFKGNDEFTGSSVGDKLIAFSGNDTIKGGGGDDIIGGSVGNDKLYGQKGADVFLFVKGDGKDKIMDFTDTGAASDDRIAITQKLYNAMSMEETATGVTLHFGAKNAIAVLNWHQADVDITDFLIG